VITIQALLDDAKCFEVVRKLRWPEGVCCPHCNGMEIAKRGMHTTQHERQRYECQGCDRQFDDLTGTVFEGHHQPLRVWITCLYLMGLNISNQQIAAELDLNKDDVQAMTNHLRDGIAVKKSQSL
jgi:transposase-like protein